MKYIIYFLTIYALTTNISIAGSAPESSSRINGYFMGYEEETYISVSDPKESIDEIKSVCSRKGDIWALGYPVPLKCIGTEFIEEGGDGPVIEIQLEGFSKLEKNHGWLLFSTKKFKEKSWVKRNASNEEIKNIEKIIKTKESEFELNEKKYTGIKFTKNKAKASVIDVNGRSFYIVFFGMTKDELDSINNEYMVIRKNENVYSFVGTFSGHIESFVDINDDDVPELKVSLDCDGTCESVIDINNTIQELIGIWNH